VPKDLEDELVETDTDANMFSENSLELTELANETYTRPYPLPYARPYPPPFVRPLYARPFPLPFARPIYAQPHAPAFVRHMNNYAYENRHGDFDGGFRHHGFRPHYGYDGSGFIPAAAGSFVGTFLANTLNGR